MVDTYINTAPSENKRQRYDRLTTVLRTEYSTFMSHHRDLADYVMPRRYRFTWTDKNKGDKRNLKIINSSATMALRTLRSGMHAGISSPVRPWFRLLTPYNDLNEFPRVKRWLYEVTERIRTVFLRSNLYNALPMVYGDQGLFATASMVMTKDTEQMMRFYVPPLGSYYLAMNDRGVVDTYVREVPMTVRQVVRQFVDFNDLPSRRWNNVSKTVKDMYSNENLDADVHVVHVVTANQDWDANYSASRFKKYASCYYEDQSNEKDKFLRESGFDIFPVVAPRWDATFGDVYGTDCPGMTALGDIKSLQLMEKRKAEAIEKMVRPPMMGPSSLKTAKASILPADITYVDVREGQQTFKPVFEVDPKVKELSGNINEHERRISRAFFEDLFMMLAMSDRREITAREIDERHEEKLIMLGPTLERDNDELLDPLIDWAFQVLVEEDELPPIPSELQLMPLKIEYVSILAQAQKMIGIGGMNNFSRYIGSLAALVPSAMDKMDTDEAINEYGDMNGVMPKIIRSADEVALIRRERAQQEQQASRMKQLETVAKGAATLSQADMSGDNALTRMVGAQQSVGG